MNNTFPQLKNSSKNDYSSSNKLFLLIDKLADNHLLKKDEYLFILNNISTYELKYLYNKAYEEKAKYYQDRVYLRGLIEISNYCKMGCKYCGINVLNKNVSRYRLSIDEIIDCCEKAYNLGYKTFVLQGGEDPFFTDDILIYLLKRIKNSLPNTRITLSLGERSKESYLKLYNHGADRYLLRHETASRRLYNHLHPDFMSFDNRRECLDNLNEIGYQTGAGFMVGSPTQTNEDLVEDLIYLKELNPHMIGIGPYLCHEDTELKGNLSGTIDETLVMVSLIRLILPKALIPATTALGSLAEDGREKALKTGANVLMTNIGPSEQKAKYEIYQNKVCNTDENVMKTIQQNLKKDGHQLDLNTGDHIDFERNNYND